MKKWRFKWPLLLLAGVGVGWYCFSKPPVLGVREGRLLPCPSSPNCVCSQDTDPEHSIAAFKFRGSGTNALQRLKSVVLNQSRTRVIDEHGGYFRVEFVTPICRYRDDVEFLLDEREGVIQVRSSSRIGYGDLGVNRKRMEHLRELFSTP
jgi:uncharacterized protein (DUF1499 family)